MTTPIDQSCATRSGLCLQQLTPFVNTFAERTYQASPSRQLNMMGALLHYQR
jgi:hypothetical protein